LFAVCFRFTRSIFNPAKVARNNPSQIAYAGFRHTSSHHQDSSSDEALVKNSDITSTPTSAYKVTPVDMTDDEINALAILMWDIMPSRLIASGDKDVVFSAQDILDFLCNSSNLWG
jgi:hypothetical protein